MAKERDIITMEEAAKILHYKPSYVRKLAVDLRRIPYKQPGGRGGRITFERQDVVDYQDGKFRKTENIASRNAITNVFLADA